MRFRIRLTVLLLGLSFALHCQPVRLTGTSTGHAGDHFPVEVITNPFLGTFKTIDTLKIYPEGDFNTELLIESPVWLNIDFGIFRSRLLVVPGETYHIKLPPKRSKTEQDIRNPFFTPVHVHLEVLPDEMRSTGSSSITGKDINSLIFTFDTLIFSNNRKLTRFRMQNRHFDADSMIRTVESEFNDIPDPYFRKYRNYRYGLTMLDSRDKLLDEVYTRYLEQDWANPFDPAYLDLFNRMYDKFLFFYSGTELGKPLKDAINREHSLSSLREILKKHPAVPNDTIADMIILKETPKVYYEDYFYEHALLIILDSLAATPSVPYFTQLAREIQDELKRLSIGSYPPGFTLPDQHGTPRSLDEFRGKYVYLLICTTDNYGCLTEYPFLNALHQKHSEYLELLTIMVTETPAQMVNFMDKYDYQWISLFYGNDQDLLRSYNVRALPVAYLIGPDGKLIQSPAALATEGLEQQLFRIMRARGDL